MFLIICLLAVGAGGYWWLHHSDRHAGLQKARDDLATTADRLKSAAQDALSHLSVEEIKQELERGGKVVRTRAREAGETLSDVAQDARVTAEIKARLIAESKLAALRISVDTTDGVVTLAGAVDSEESIAHAMRIALEAKGVRQVISTLQVKPAK
jgi:osmotically-inducible protein OsmY